MNDFIHNPTLYRKLSEPIGDIEKTNQAIEAFVMGVRELREKHHIQDVYLIMAGSGFDDKGVEGAWIMSAHHGNIERAEGMIAYAYGYEQAERKARIERIVAKRGAGKPESR